jgi:O-methyltransferase
VNDPLTTTDSLRDRHLELVKRALMDDLGAGDVLAPMGRPDSPLKRLAFDLIARAGVIPAYREDRDGRLAGSIWPTRAVTMLGHERLDNIRACIEDVLANDVPGDCIEAGVWRGGGSMYMRAVLDAHDAHDRRVWLADSFAGLPEPDPRYPADAGSTFHTAQNLAVSLEQVKANFDRFGLLSDRVVFLKGWFSETLPGTTDETWSLVRLDGDMYESTIDAITALYPNLSVGGWVIVDDYKTIDSCRQAIDDYRAANGITEPLQDGDWQSVCWKRER